MKLCQECNKAMLVPASAYTLIWKCPVCNTIERSEISIESSSYFTKNNENYEQKLMRVLREPNAVLEDRMHQMCLAC